MVTKIDWCVTLPVSVEVYEDGEPTEYDVLEALLDWVATLEDLFAHGESIRQYYEIGDDPIVEEE